jgi:hypothetical protein
MESCWVEAPDIAKLSGATVELWLDNARVRSTTTNSEGYFRFGSVVENLNVPYHLKICFNDGNGNTVCFETNDFILDSVNLHFWFHYDSHEPNDSFWCGGLTTNNAQIQGYVWDDVDGDGIVDDDEPVRAGVHIQLMNAAGTVVLSEKTTTGAGWFVFNGLEAGTYQTMAEGVSLSGAIDLHAGDLDTADYDFPSGTWYITE